LLIFGKNKSGDYSFSPIAIVGVAFRFPGDVGDIADFWQGLKEGRDFISQIPENRWATSELQHPKRSEPGRSITFSAGVLSRIDEFDAEFSAFPRARPLGSIPSNVCFWSFPGRPWKMPGFLRRSWLAAIVPFT